MQYKHTVLNNLIYFFFSFILSCQYRSSAFCTSEPRSTICSYHILQVCHPTTVQECDFNNMMVEVFIEFLQFKLLNLKMNITYYIALIVLCRVFEIFVDRYNRTLRTKIFGSAKTFILYLYSSFIN